jgi:hypothetical protein
VQFFANAARNVDLKKSVNIILLRRFTTKRNRRLRNGLAATCFHSKLRENFILPYQSFISRAPPLKVLIRRFPA